MLCYPTLPVQPCLLAARPGSASGSELVGQPDSEACHMPQVPYTPIIPLLYGLRASLDLLASEGFENVVKRHNR